MARSMFMSPTITTPSAGQRFVGAKAVDAVDEHEIADLQRRELGKRRPRFVEVHERRRGPLLVVKLLRAAEIRGHRKELLGPVFLLGG